MMSKMKMRSTPLRRARARAGLPCFTGRPGIYVVEYPMPQCPSAPVPQCTNAPMQQAEAEAEAALSGWHAPVDDEQRFERGCCRFEEGHLERRNERSKDEGYARDRVPYTHELGCARIDLIPGLVDLFCLLSRKVGGIGDPRHGRGPWRMSALWRRTGLVLSALRWVVPNPKILKTRHAAPRKILLGCRSHGCITRYMSELHVLFRCFFLCTMAVSTRHQPTAGTALQTSARS